MSDLRRQQTEFLNHLLPFTGFIGLIMAFIAVYIEDHGIIIRSHIGLTVGCMVIFALLKYRMYLESIPEWVDMVIIDCTIMVYFIWGASMLGFETNGYVGILDFTMVMLIGSVVLPVPFKHYLGLTFMMCLYLFFLTPFIQNQNLTGQGVLLPISSLLLIVVSGFICYLTFNRAMETLRVTRALERQRENLETLVLQKTQALKQREDDFSKEVILVLSSVIEHYDAYTKGHSEKVAHLSEVIARQLGYDIAFQQEIYWAGLIHDIGKIRVPKELLNKPGYLTNEEYRLLQQHPVYGYEMIKSSIPLKNVSKYVFHHHEHYDGRGYPLGLKGDMIPRASQILSVADSWDAMRSERVYRSALSVDEARRELSLESGKQFAPDVVEVFLKLEESFF